MKGYVPFGTSPFYHSVYCGTATRIAENFGYQFRSIVSFESVLLAHLSLLRLFPCSAWCENLPEEHYFQKRRCCLPGIVYEMPSKKEHKAALDGPAAVAYLFAEQSLIDKVIDNQSRHVARLLLKFFSQEGKEKAKQLVVQAWGSSGSNVLALIELFPRIQFSGEVQANLKADAEPCIAPSGQLGSLLFASIHPDLAGLGDTVGRLVYINDALDDLIKDRETHQFNPFLLDKRGTTEIALQCLDQLRVPESLYGPNLPAFNFLQEWRPRILYLAQKRGIPFQENHVEKPTTWFYDDIREKCGCCLI